MWKVVLPDGSWLTGHRQWFSKWTLIIEDASAPAIKALKGHEVFIPEGVDSCWLNLSLDRASERHSRLVIFGVIAVGCGIVLYFAPHSKPYWYHYPVLLAGVAAAVGIIWGYAAELRAWYDSRKKEDKHEV